jgi:hypothetical protein
MTPFWAPYYQHPEMQFKMPKASSLQSVTQADILLKRLEESHWVLQENKLKA